MYVYEKENDWKRFYQKRFYVHLSYVLDGIQCCFSSVCVEEPAR